VIASTGIDPNTLNEGSRNVSAFFSELNVPVLKNLDVTAAVRYDKYSDFGHTANPKLGFRFQPAKEVLLRGSYSKGFRAPSLYDINAGNAYTNAADTLNDPKNCPGGVPQPGKPASANCNQQFRAERRPTRPEPGTFEKRHHRYRVGTDQQPVGQRRLVDHPPDPADRQPADYDVLNNPDLFASHIIRNASGNLAVDGSQCPNPVTCGYLDLRTRIWAT
jgi:iron complex outermembrane receptor protein